MTHAAAMPTNDREPLVARVMPFPGAGATGRDATPGDPELAPEARPRLEILRQLAVASRLTGRCDPFRDCRLAAAAGDACPRRCALAFFRLLGPAAERRLEFRTPGAPSATPDELWLLRLLERIGDGDAASVRALIAFRVARVHRRRMLGAAVEFETVLQKLELATL